MTLVGAFTYFGAFLIPAGYLAVAGISGSARRGMLIGAALQAFWSLAVYGFAWYSWRAGYTEWYWAYAMLVPVNIVAAIYYCAFLLWKRRHDKSS